MDNEEKYLEISRKLKNLEPVKASDNFVHSLHSKIVEFEAEKRKEHKKRYDESSGGFLRNLFGNMKNPWLVPAAGFTVLIFFVFYITFLNKNTSEKNAPLLLDQKQENIEQKNSTADQNKTSVINTDSSLKENLPDKDIAGDLKTKENERSPSPVENTSDQSYGREMKKSTIPLKTNEPSDEDMQQKRKSYDIQNYKKQETEQKESVDKDKLTSEPQTAESSISAESQTYSDSGSTFKRKADEDDPVRKKLDEKLRRINKSNLERIREEIIK